MIDPDRSLVVHDPALLTTPFAFRRTLTRIVETSGDTSGTTPETLLQTMLNSFNLPAVPHPVTSKAIPVTQRAAESGLSAADLLDPAKPIGMIPVGLFNRFDLAPKDGSNCGEYRIVYARRDPPTVFERFFIIFEARLPNPTPADGLKGCLPVAKLWADLSNEPNAATRISRLEQFYYVGITGFGPVVDHANYGMPDGQIRENMFMQQPWILREHRTALPSGIAVFQADSIKRNPLVEWFRPPAALPPTLTPADQAAFRAAFLKKPTCDLLLPDRANPGATEFEIVNGIGIDPIPSGDDMESISQPPPPTADDPASGTDPAFQADIAARLNALSVNAVNATQLLNRAGAMTCGGCHEFSKGKDLGSAAVWPEDVPPGSKRFVHINETGVLSDALTAFFLPRRAEILARFVCDPTPEPQPEAPCGGVDPTALPTTIARMPPVPTLPAAGATGLDPAVARDLRKGRVLERLQRVDEARLAVLAATKRRRTAAPDAAGVAATEAAQATAALEALVLRARIEEQALPGAFIPVRRTH